MDFDVAVPWWWTPAAAISGIVFLVYTWFWAAGKYPDEPVKQLGSRLFAVVLGLALPFLMHAANSEHVLVRGETLEVRDRFFRDQRTYALQEVSSYGFERRRTGRTGASVRHTELVLLFRDGSSLGIHEKYDNYQRLANHLQNNGIRER